MSLCYVNCFILIAVFSFRRIFGSPYRLQGWWRSKCSIFTCKTIHITKYKIFIHKLFIFRTNMQKRVNHTPYWISLIMTVSHSSSPMFLLETSSGPKESAKDGKTWSKNICRVSITIYCSTYTILVICLFHFIIFYVWAYVCWTDLLKGYPLVSNAIVASCGFIDR